MLTVAVLNQKGGVGKTTLAMNLAAAGFLSGESTLLLDLDPQGSALDWHHARQPGSQLDGLQVAREASALDAPRFRSLSKGYDFVVIDSPPQLSTVTRSVAALADVALIPLRPGPLDLWALQETLASIELADRIRARMKRRAIPRLFVLNQLGRTRLAQAAPDALNEAGPHCSLANVTIGARVAFAEAANLGESVLTLAPRSAAAREIRDLYSEIVNPSLKAAA